MDISIDVDGAISTLALFASYFVFVVIGFCLVVFGSLDIFDNDFVTKILEDYYLSTIGVFLIFIGLCIFGVTFFGCWNALYEHFSTLFTYGMLLSFLLLFQLIIYGTAIYFCKIKLENALEKFFGEYYTQNQNQEIKQMINHIQQTYSCCGVKGPEFWKAYDESFPPSCCSNDYRICNASNVYQNGCFNDIEEYIASKFHLSWIFCFLVIQILLIGWTFYMAKDLISLRSPYESI